MRGTKGRPPVTLQCRPGPGTVRRACLHFMAFGEGVLFPTPPFSTWRKQDSLGWFPGSSWKHPLWPSRAVPLGGPAWAGRRPLEAAADEVSAPRPSPSSSRPTRVYLAQGGRGRDRDAWALASGLGKKGHRAQESLGSAQAPARVTPGLPTEVVGQELRMR